MPPVPHPMSMSLITNFQDLEEIPDCSWKKTMLIKLSPTLCIYKSRKVSIVLSCSPCLSHYLTNLEVLLQNHFLQYT